MNPRTTLSVLGIVVVLGLISTARAEAMTCTGTLLSRAYADTVFQGTIVDRRFAITRQGPFFYPTIEYEAAATRVWKGPASRRIVFTTDGRLASSLRIGLTALMYTKAPTYNFDPYFFYSCAPTTVRVDRAAASVDELGVPIATFAASAPPASASSRSWSRRIQAMWVLGLTHFTTPDLLVRSRRFWSDGPFVIVLTTQIVAALWFLRRRQFKRCLGLSATAGATTIVTLLWTGHALLGTPIYDRLNQLL